MQVKINGKNEQHSRHDTVFKFKMSARNSSMKINVIWNEILISKGLD